MIQQTYRPTATIILIASMTIVFVFESLFPSIVTYYSFVPLYAYQNPMTFITSVFLHYGLNHIFLNMLALFVFGLVLESRIGHSKFLFLFFLAGIAGNFGYMLTSMNSSIPALGASGAIYGIIGASTVLMPFAIVWIGAPMPVVAVAVLWAISDFIGLFVPSDVAHGAHLLGLAVGLAYGFYLRKAFGKNRKGYRYL